MLFNSFAFILFFLPIAIFGYYLCAQRSFEWAAVWLAMSSLFFYGWWNPQFLLLLLASINFNYLLGRVISNRRNNVEGKTILVMAIVANMALLIFFKYTNFFVATSNASIGTEIENSNIILPLGISIFTLTQIVFLIDVYRGHATEYRLIHYILFVSYFPHLIAGPLLHHRQIMPQFSNPATFRLKIDRLSIGLTIFAIGLVKKVLIADRIAPYANNIFDAASNGGVVNLFEAWIGALAYTFQLYFDFSGYTDMAIGASCMLGISLPLNFNSPYKSLNIIEFWRRWHMTLSEFLRNYLYIPLGGNKNGPLRRYVNLMITMILGGLWHGASWTFVAWGVLHGAYLVVNHGWRSMMCWREVHSDTKRIGTGLTNFLSGALTFIAVVLAWVIFRADSFSAAVSIYKGMLGMNGISLPPYIPEKFTLFATWLEGFGVVFNGIAPVTNFSMRSVVGLLAISSVICFLLPNTQEFMHRYMPGYSSGSVSMGSAFWQYKWKPKLVWACVFSAFFSIAFLGLTQETHFLYFQF